MIEEEESMEGWRTAEMVVRNQTNPRGHTPPPIKPPGQVLVNASSHIGAAPCSSLIVEFFGPPAVGKTTISRHLTSALEVRGVDVQLVASSRPSERNTGPEHGDESRWVGSALTAPMSRAGKLFSAFPVLKSEPGLDPVTSELLETFPPKSWLRSVRLRRYLSALASSWKAARAARSVVIFDQGYLCALCALFSTSRRIDLDALEYGLDLIPAPELLIRLEAPDEVLAMRVRDRLGRQSLFERIFEHDAETSLRQSEFAAAIDRLLSRRARTVLKLDCSSPDSINTAVETIVAKMSAKQKGTLT